jgi:hypothetical protein
MSVINVAEQGHVVTLVMPHDAQGHATNSDVLNMEGYEHCTMIVSIGAASRAAGVITVQSCSALGGGGTNTAIDYTAYKCETAYGSANDDVLGAAVAVDDVTGIVPPVASTGIFYVIELTSGQLLTHATTAVRHVGFRLCVADPAAESFISAIAILSGSRYAKPGSPTVVD